MRGRVPQLLLDGVRAESCGDAVGPPGLVGVGQPQTFDDARGEPIVGPLERVAAGCLDRVDPGHPVQGAEFLSFSQPLDHGTGQRAAPDLHEQPVQRGALLRQMGGKLVAERHPAFDGQAVLVALAGEGQRSPEARLAACRSGRGWGPGGGHVTGRTTRELERVIRGISRRPFLAGNHVHIRAQFLQPGDDLRVAPRRNEHHERTIAGLRHHGRRQCCVAARGDRQVRFAGHGQPDTLDYLQVDQQPHQVPGLVRAGDVAGLVLHPHATAGAQPEPLAQPLAAAERRHDEPAAVDRLDLFVDPADQVEVVVVAHAVSPGHVV
jgi:hypothetical protein